jgi:hypothetical protein
MSYKQNTQIMVFLVLAMTLVQSMAYQNCSNQFQMDSTNKRQGKQTEDTSGNGQPYGGVVARYYHVNKLSNTISTNSSSKMELSPSNKFNEEICIADARLDYFNNKYFLFDSLCTNSSDQAVAQEIPTQAVTQFTGLPIITYNSKIWQEAQPSDLFNPNFQWYIDLCSTIEGFYFNTNLVDPTLQSAELQIQKETQDLLTTEGEIINIKITNIAMEDKHIYYVFSNISSLETILAQTQFTLTRKITRNGTSSNSDIQMRLETVEHYVLNQLEHKDDHLLITRRNLVDPAKPIILFDGNLFCQ